MARVLRRGVDEGTAAVAGIGAVLLEQIEHRKNALLCRPSTSRQLPRDVASPCVTSIAKVCGNQVILRLEVEVERGLGHTRLLDDPLDPDRADAIRIEELACHGQDSVSGAGLPSGRSHVLSAYQTHRSTVQSDRPVRATDRPRGALACQ